MNFSNWKLSRDLGASFGALIPKKDGAVSIRDYCSISLIGSTYKILAKVMGLLASRVWRILSYVLSPKQGTFADARQILETEVKC